MAESSLHDVALNTQSVGDDLPSDAPATTTDNHHIGEDAEEGSSVKLNGDSLHHQDILRADDQALDDGTNRSDSDTSRANSITGEGKTLDSKFVKKFVTTKPISFAKYSVPKTVTNVPPKVSVEKTPTTPTVSTTNSTPFGRPRLVAKTNSSNQQKLTAYKPAAPDPMQVWNKNRATPQASTKNLTDEELKQQYGIHISTRLQSDNDGKEAKWADIDDDEDDWAPETIEWNDGTKTTVNPADPPTSKANAATSATVSDAGKATTAPKLAGPQYSSSVGPNATVLKVGANAGRQQAQRALAQQSNGATEKPALLTSKAAPAPPPSKSPWAKLPEIDKISPVAINPQPVMPASGRFPSGGSFTPLSTGAAPSPAKEISADDFNRSWRNSPSSQTKELFMPSSGRYEAVSDGKRRMSKNEQSFRAPAVLQRPNQKDVRSPAEPSAAFQTTRTSIDQGRRRASSSISGASGQFGRRMSFKSADTISLSQPDTAAPLPVQQDDAPTQMPTPTTYQARGAEYAVGGPDTVTDVDLEAQRAAQKALMKEKIDKARQRKIDEEQRLEAEKQERIRLKLASLGPPPEQSKQKQEDVIPQKSLESTTVPTPILTTSTVIPSPPKPPQPLATGEPQQYGMMKVHPLDSVKKFSSPTTQTTEVSRPVVDLTTISQPLDIDTTNTPSTVNGIRPNLEISRPVSDEIVVSEPSPKLPKPPGPLSGDARIGWGNTRNDHRSPQAGNLWGIHHNKALGNGTFDSSLAGYSPQDLSRTSSTGQNWMNGRTPTVGQSPQLNHVSQHVPETRSHLLQSMTSPDSQPLSLNSEIDSALPISRPAPIGRPQLPSASQNQSSVNGHSNNGHASTIAAWNNFGSVARVQEKADAERLDREIHERKEEEKRTGVRQQAPYTFTETFKQVQLGEQVGQRSVSHTIPVSQSPGNLFGAVGFHPVGDGPSRGANGQYGQLGRGSRFFPQQLSHNYMPERRAVTYSHPEIQRAPSPPPAEEYASLHPAFDGDYQRPKVHFPRERAIVRLPPAASPSPPVPPKEPTPPPQPKAPLTWAARASLPPPAPAPAPLRAVSTPLANLTSWQEKFNGLLYGKPPNPPRVAPAPAQASSREPLDIMPVTSAAAVSLPVSHTDEVEEEDSNITTSKDVEDEEDLFEDREAGSLPTVNLPRESYHLSYSLPTASRVLSAPVDPNSIHMFMVNNWNERVGHAKPQYAIVKTPGTTGKGVKRDLPIKSGVGPIQTRVRSPFVPRNHTRPTKPSSKPRVVSKVH